jgi:hypothetical protein
LRATSNGVREALWNARFAVTVDAQRRTLARSIKSWLYGTGGVRRDADCFFSDTLVVGIVISIRGFPR